MIYEIYSKQGIPMAVEFSGTLEDVMNLIAANEFLFGRNFRGKREVLFVRRGDNVAHVCEAEDDWDAYIKLDDLKPIHLEEQAKP